jgi:hypothetical protein
MSALPVPVRTAGDEPLPPFDGGGLHRLDWTLLGTIDGRRNVVHIESVAKAIGLDAGALTRLEQRGLIVFEGSAAAIEPPLRPRCEHDD